ncbi:hypothetical protein [Nonomuraea rubra]|uniref:hypothetical protein n=1 Tax=Nonomuraea rubra TaxID=46180 RepID=UPI0031ED27FB
MNGAAPPLDRIAQKEHCHHDHHPHDQDQHTLRLAGWGAVFLMSAADAAARPTRPAPRAPSP